MHYYLLRHGVKVGPYSEQRLYSKYFEGEIPGDTLCCPRRTYKENPDAPWTPLFKILRRIYPGRQPDGAADRLSRREIEHSNTTSAIAAILGLVTCFIFLVGYQPAPKAEPGSTAVAQTERPQIFQTAFRIAGSIAGALLATGGVLSIIPKRES